MKLVSFTAKNYRSIIKAYKLPLGNLSVLVGPNNEGKSNILNAIVTALGLISQSQLLVSGKMMRYRYRSVRGRISTAYDWPRDFPMGLQEGLPEGRSEFGLEFSLTMDERAKIKSATKTNLTKNLKLKLGLGPEDAKVDVVLQGKGKKYLAQHLQFLAKFVAERIDVQYVPAIRPSDLAIDIVEDLLSKELATLEAHADYKAIVKQLEAKQRPVLDRLGMELTKTVASFIPEVKSVTIDTQTLLRRAIRRSCEVTIDDGTRTDLELKGDGVKSLTAISLVRHTSQKALAGRQLILAIEEPESHLHPRAAHRLREVLEEIARTHQVILTTHSPVMVNRAAVNTNIVVNDSRATPAKRLQDIRDALGVQVSDNLTTASLILLVEGEEDANVLSVWLRALSDLVKTSMANGSLVIDSLGGGHNLRYKLGLYRSLVCNVYAFVDNDDAGRQAVNDAMAANLLSHAEYTQASCHGLKDSELEDLIAEPSYEAQLKNELGIVITSKHMSHNKKSWTERMRDNCIEQGKPWTKQLEGEVKRIVSKSASAAGLSALNPARRGPIDSLVAALESRLGSPSN